MSSSFSRATCCAISPIRFAPPPAWTRPRIWCAFGSGSCPSGRRPDAFRRGDHWTGLELDGYARGRDSIFGQSPPPASALGVRELLCRGAMVEVDMICIKEGTNIDSPRSCQLGRWPGRPQARHPARRLDFSRCRKPDRLARGGRPGSPRAQYHRRARAGRFELLVGLDA